MNQYITHKRGRLPYRILSAIIAFTFFFSLILPAGTSMAQIIPQSFLNLPLPGSMVPVSPGFFPVNLKAVTIDPTNPLHFDFIIDTGDNDLAGEELNAEAKKLVKYFLAALTVPEDELWVNLSPHEKNRVVPDALGVTNMGVDLLAQDYILKQLTASLIYPEDELGQKFWDRVYAKTEALYGTRDIPLNTFNKVWIVPHKAVVYEHNGSAFVVKRELKVMLEEDYMALQKNLNNETSNQSFGLNQLTKDDAEIISGVTSEIVREILIPAIEKEVNEGKNFSNLRQIYNAMILATWYKKNLKNSLLGQVYMDQNKIKGIDVSDKDSKAKIYDQYLDAFERGVYNYIREDYDPTTQEVTPRKYFSGGAYGTTVAMLDEEHGVLDEAPHYVKEAVRDPESNFGQYVDYGVILKEYPNQPLPQAASGLRSQKARGDVASEEPGVREDGRRVSRRGEGTRERTTTEEDRAASSSSALSKKIEMATNRILRNQPGPIAEAVRAVVRAYERNYIQGRSSQKILSRTEAILNSQPVEPLAPGIYLREGPLEFVSIIDSLLPAKSRLAAFAKFKAIVNEVDKTSSRALTKEWGEHYRHVMSDPMFNYVPGIETLRKVFNELRDERLTGRTFEERLNSFEKDLRGALMAEFIRIVAEEKHDFIIRRSPLFASKDVIQVKTGDGQINVVTEDDSLEDLNSIHFAQLIEKRNEEAEERVLKLIGGDTLMIGTFLWFKRAVATSLLAEIRDKNEVNTRYQGLFKLDLKKKQLAIKLETFETFLRGVLQEEFNRISGKEMQVFIILHSPYSSKNNIELITENGEIKVVTKDIESKDLNSFHYAQLIIQSQKNVKEQQDMLRDPSHVSSPFTVEKKLETLKLIKGKVKEYQEHKEDTQLDDGRLLFWESSEAVNAFLTADYSLTGEVESYVKGQYFPFQTLFKEVLAVLNDVANDSDSKLLVTFGGRDGSSKYTVDRELFTSINELGLQLNPAEIILRGQSGSLAALVEESLLATEDKYKKAIKAKRVTAASSPFDKEINEARDRVLFGETGGEVVDAVHKFVERFKLGFDTQRNYATTLERIKALIEGGELADLSTGDVVKVSADAYFRIFEEEGLPAELRLDAFEKFAAIVNEVERTVGVRQERSSSALKSIDEVAATVLFDEGEVTKSNVSLLIKEFNKQSVAFVEGVQEEKIRKWIYDQMLTRLIEKVQNKKKPVFSENEIVAEKVAEALFQAIGNISQLNATSAVQAFSEIIIKHKNIPQGTQAGSPMSTEQIITSISNKKNVEDIPDEEIEGKVFVVRVDWNVPLKDGIVQDIYRIEQSLATIQYITDRGGKVIVASHQEKDKIHSSLEPMVEAFKKLTSKADRVFFKMEGRGKAFLTMKEANTFIRGSMQKGDVLVLENIRFNQGEKVLETGANGKTGQIFREFADDLFYGVDAVVIDAMGVVHRNHASLTGVPEGTPTYAGILLKNELEAAQSILTTLGLAIMGGSKISDKLPMIKNLLAIDTLEHVLIGGAMANTMLKARGYDIGASVGDNPEEVEMAKGLLREKRVRVPSYLLIAESFTADARHTIVKVPDNPSQGFDVPAEWKSFMILDVLDAIHGDFTKYVNEIPEGKTIFWNGPMGVFDKFEYAQAGTRAMGEAVAAAKAMSVGGGGDTVKAVNDFDLTLDFLSTGGGSLLMLLSGEPLPGVNAIDNVASSALTSVNEIVDGIKEGSQRILVHGNEKIIPRENIEETSRSQNKFLAKLFVEGLKVIRKKSHIDVEIKDGKESYEFQIVITLSDVISLGESRVIDDEIAPRDDESSTIQSAKDWVSGILSPDSANDDWHYSIEGSGRESFKVIMVLPTGDQTLEAASRVMYKEEAAAASQERGDMFTFLVKKYALLIGRTYLAKHMEKIRPWLSTLDELTVRGVNIDGMIESAFRIAIQSEINTLIGGKVVHELIREFEDGEDKILVNSQGFQLTDDEGNPIKPELLNAFQLDRLYVLLKNNIRAAKQTKIDELTGGAYYHELIQEVVGSDEQVLVTSHGFQLTDSQGKPIEPTALSISQLDRLYLALEERLGEKLVAEQNMVASPVMIHSVKAWNKLTRGNKVLKDSLTLEFGSLIDPVGNARDFNEIVLAKDSNVANAFIDTFRFFAKHVGNTVVTSDKGAIVVKISGAHGYLKMEIDMGYFRRASVIAKEWNERIKLQLDSALGRKFTKFKVLQNEDLLTNEETGVVKFFIDIDTDSLIEEKVGENKIGKKGKMNIDGASSPFLISKENRTNIRTVQTEEWIRMIDDTDIIVAVGQLVARMVTITVGGTLQKLVEETSDAVMFNISGEKKKGNSTDYAQEALELLDLFKRNINRTDVDVRTSYKGDRIQFEFVMPVASSGLQRKSADDEVQPGGIDLNPQYLDLQIKRDGNGIPLPLLQQPLHLINIEGFTPIIINVLPVTNLPLFLGLYDNKEPSPFANDNPRDGDLLARKENYFDLSKF